MKILYLNHGLNSSLYSQGTERTSQQKNNNDASFTGLTKKMKKHTYIDGQRDIKPIVDDYKAKDKSLIVGSLPKFMLDKLPKENRKEVIMEIYETFDQVAEELREFDETKVTSIDEIKKRRNKSTVNLLNDVLKKYNILREWDDVDLEYLGKGGKGAGYKISGLRDFSNGNEDEFIIKVFHVIEGSNWQYSKSHGCYAELNSAAYWMNNVGSDTNRGKFFFGNMKSGYMVNKYVDDDVRLPKRTIDPYKYGLKCTDESIEHKHNTCKGYSFDWGGVRVVNRLKNGDKYARKILEEIKDTPEDKRLRKWVDLFTQKDTNPESKNAGLAMAVKHMPDEYKFACIDLCLSERTQKVEQGLAYALKYLPYKDAIKYFEKLVQTDDTVTQIVLFNEIPLLAMMHRDQGIKDDLQTTKSKILPARVAAYYDIAEKYAKPDSIEHLASFLHLLPKDKFRTYYSRLAKIDNYDLHDRMIYKLSMVDAKDYDWALSELAENVKDEDLRKKIISKISKE